MMSDFEDPERSYRRGYGHGAWDVFEATRAFLPAREAARIERWFTTDVTKWRSAAATGKSKRGAEGFPTVDLRPPRDKLNKAAK